MNLLRGLVLVMVCLAGLGVVLTREPVRQSIVLSFFGLLLGLLFFVFQAPDVALSQIAVGAVALPLMMLLALAKIRRKEETRKRDSGH